MPSQHKHTSITARPDPDLRQRFADAAEEAGTNVNAVVIALMRYWLGDTHEPPPRPALPADTE